MAHGTAQLPVEGELPDLDGANAWLNSEPLTPDGLRGKVVLAEFCTFSCVNWLRTLPYVRAWDRKYRDHGLVVLGIHTPEFPFEHALDGIQHALDAMGVEYPIAVDNDYAVWRAFENNYWPALYFADKEGRIRHHRFGEEDYERSEAVIQQLLEEAGFDGFDRDLVSPVPEGVEVAADRETLGSPEAYVGYARAQNLASPGGFSFDQPHDYTAPPELGLNQWALSGNWTVGRQTTVLNQADGGIAFRFHARDVNLVMGADRSPVRFRVQIDAEPPGAAHGGDIDESGDGTVTEARLYQLVRQPGNVSDRTIEITLLAAGAQAYVFTFG
jgi:Thioredoxin like C-terminal domain